MPFSESAHVLNENLIPVVEEVNLPAGTPLHSKLDFLLADAGLYGTSELVAGEVVEAKIGRAARHDAKVTASRTIRRGIWHGITWPSKARTAEVQSDEAALDPELTLMDRKGGEYGPDCAAAYVVEATMYGQGFRLAGQ